MSEPIQYKFSLTKLFAVAKCVNTPAGRYFDLPAAPEDATPVSETLVVCPEILMVTSGAFDLQVPELGTISLQAGDISSSERFKGPLRIVSTADESAYVCLTPRDKSFWQRRAVFVGAGDHIEIDTPPADDAYVFVAVGGLQEGLVGSLVQLSPGAETTLTAVMDTHLIHLWK